MIVFFYASEDTRTKVPQAGFGYEHEFPGVTPEEEASEIPVNKIYMTTPNDYANHQKYLQTVGGMPLKNIHPQKIINTPFFPRDLGSGNIEEKLGDLKEKREIKIAIMNGMSKALGDHLIGMNALNLLHEHLRQYFDKITITLFQLHPARLNPITMKWPFCEQTYILPTTLAALATFDAFYDFGGLVALKGFDKEPMIDFFLRTLSLDPDKIPEEKKRTQFAPSPQGADVGRMLIRQIKKQSKERPILLFHHGATSPIRTMDKKNAQRLIKDIIKGSDYFVVSALDLGGFKHERFIDLHKFSTTIDNFTAIISTVDAIVTVDTSTYHIADAFNIPTVVLFSSIEPDLRARYYPKARGLLLCKKNSPLYGKHRIELMQNKENQEEFNKANAEAAENWDKLTSKRILLELSNIS